MRPSPNHATQQLPNDDDDDGTEPDQGWRSRYITVSGRSNIRVRNSANPCVRDMSKSLRTCQMSVHGYPVDMLIFCNLQLGLLELQEETPQADINQDNVSLAGVLQGAVGRAVDTPVFALLLDDNTRFSHDRRWDGACSRDASGRRFPNPSASRARRFCSS